MDLSIKIIVYIASLYSYLQASIYFIYPLLINSAEMFLFLYKMYVQSHLEYCVQSWSPYLARDIDILEKVQRRATKHVYGLNSLPYEGRLEKLQLYSSFCRRQRGDMIETYKILHNYYNIEPSLFFTSNDLSTTRSHSLKLLKERSRLLVRHNFFFQIE